MQSQRRVGLTMRILTNQIRREIENEMSALLPDEITFWQARVLGFIRKHSQKGDVFQKDIEQIFDIRRSTASRLLQALEKNELILRKPNPQDARMKSLLLTPKALALQTVIEQEINRIEDLLADQLTKEELDTFFIITEKLSRAISDKNKNMEKGSTLCAEKNKNQAGE